MSFLDDSRHAGELLALADGELEADEELRVRAHLEECDDCSAELAELLDARTVLRSLPSLAPPGDFIEGIVRRRHRILVFGSGLGFAAAVVVVVVAITATVSPVPSIDPHLAARTAEHARLVAGEGTSASGAGDDAIDAPVALRGYRLVTATEDSKVVHAVYRKGDGVVSVFAEPGRLDWDELPSGGERIQVGVREGWAEDHGDTVVIDAGGQVVTLIGDDPHALSGMVSEVPDAPERGWWRRAHDACQELVKAFAVS